MASEEKRLPTLGRFLMEGKTYNINSIVGVLKKRGYDDSKIDKVKNQLDVNGKQVEYDNFEDTMIKMGLNKNEINSIAMEIPDK